MPERLIALIEELQKNEFQLDFTADGIQLKKTKKNLQSALREKFTNAIKMIDIRKRELAKGIKDSKIKVKDEYYLFIRQFLSTLEVDYDHPALRFNSYPICTDKSCKLVKIHYLFQMLGVDAMFVADRGKLLGRMKLETLLNFKYK